MTNTTSKPEFYTFIQKTVEGSDGPYDLYMEYVTEYMTTILLFGNTIVLLLIILIKDDTNQVPKTGMLGRLLTQDYKGLFRSKLGLDLVKETLLFNNALNQVKHSLFEIGPNSLTSKIIYFFEFNILQLVEVSETKQKENIELAQSCIKKIQSKITTR